MTSPDEAVRLAVYRGFAATGRCPDDAALAAAAGIAVDEVPEVLARLAAARHVVLDDAGEIVLAHPFSSRNLGFSVLGADTLWFGGWAWDSFALPHLVPDEPEVLVATTCPACRAPHAFLVDRDAPPPGDQVAHFLVPVAHMWDDVVHTCSNQRIFCSEACVDAWLDGRPRGDVLDLPTLWALARGWYAGRLDPGYQRREPAAAADYFRSVGLHGPFWGLSDDS